MNKFTHIRKLSLQIGLVFFFDVVLILLLSMTSILCAESIEEGARREGKLLFYSQMTAPNSLIVINAFQKKYPFIKAEYYRAGTETLLQKVLQEKKMGRALADVVSTSGIWVNIYKKEGLLGKYTVPESKILPQGFKDPEGFWTANYTAYYSFIYNTNMVAKKDLPKTYEELLDHRWKGKIGLSLNDVEWFIGMLDFFGEEKGKLFMKRLAEQDPILRQGRSIISILMIAGEFPLALSVVQTTQARQKEGAPIEMVPFATPTLAGLRTIGVHANAPHPNAARLFVDFTLSKEGQSILTQISYHPVRKDVKVDPVVEKIMRNMLPIKPREAELVEGYTLEMAKIFQKRQANR